LNKKNNFFSWLQLTIRFSIFRLVRIRHLQFQFYFLACCGGNRFWISCELISELQKNWCIWQFRSRFLKGRSIEFWKVTSSTKFSLSKLFCHDVSRLRSSKGMFSFKFYLELAHVRFLLVKLFVWLLMCFESKGILVIT
jgi:hypothetical protein